jgi:hypothetical protein
LRREVSGWAGARRMYAVGLKTGVAGEKGTSDEGSGCGAAGGMGSRYERPSSLKDAMGASSPGGADCSLGSPG